MPRPELGEPDHIADPATGSVALDGADGHARGRPRRRLTAGVLVVVMVLTVAFAIGLARIGLRSPRHRRCRLRPVRAPTTVLVSADGVVVAEVTGAVTEQRLLAMIHGRLGITTG